MGGRVRLSSRSATGDSPSCSRPAPAGPASSFVHPSRPPMCGARVGDTSDRSHHGRRMPPIRSELMEALLLLVALAVAWLVGLLVVIWVLPALLVVVVAKASDGPFLER